MSQGFFASPISENLSKTSQGFLVAKNVRLARAGFQAYTAEELRINSDQPLINVYRPPEEVFHPESLRSYTGVDITDNHPAGGRVDSSSRWASRGHVQDVRRDGDFVVGTLVVKDDDLINKIMAGQRETSVGYDYALSCWRCKQLLTECGCDEPIPAQMNIRANHLAIVSDSRCGRQCCIQDSAPPWPRLKPFDAMCLDYAATVQAFGIAQRARYRQSR